MKEITPAMILNWDQTGIHLVPSSLWTMEKQGSKRVEMVGSNDKRIITAVLCGSLIGDFLPIQLILKGKRDDVTHVAIPLHTLIRKNVQWEWTPNCHRAFQALKYLLTKARVGFPILYSSIHTGYRC